MTLIAVVFAYFNYLLRQADFADSIYGGCSGLHYIPYIGSWNKDLDTDILLYYLLTCDPPSRSFESSAAL